MMAERSEDSGLRFGLQLCRLGVPRKLNALLNVSLEILDSNFQKFFLVFVNRRDGVRGLDGSAGLFDRQ